MSYFLKEEKIAKFKENVDFVFGLFVWATYIISTIIIVGNSGGEMKWSVFFNVVLAYFAIEIFYWSIRVILLAFYKKYLLG